MEAQENSELRAALEPLPGWPAAPDPPPLSPANWEHGRLWFRFPLHAVDPFGGSEI